MSDAEHHPRYDLHAVRDRMQMPDLAQQLGIELRQSGGRWVGLCPFHSERSPSFGVSLKSGKGWVFHCFGCGAHGDVFDMWQRVRGGSLQEAVRALAGIAGMAPMPDGWKPAKMPRNAALPERPKRPARFPELRRLSERTCEEIAELRGLSVEGVLAAREAGMVWGAELGISIRSGLVWGANMLSEERAGKLRIGPVRCWIVADGAGYAMQARRLDGGVWERHEGGSFKAYTIGTAKWPLGARMIGDRRRVALVEGGPDILAAYHFLSLAGSLKEVAVVGILGASVRIHEDALPAFVHRRVRIFPHFDKVDPRTGKQAGYQAAARWTDELTEAGAEVDVYDFEDLMQADGRAVGDLNDAARGDAECVRIITAGDEVNPPAFDFHPSILS